MKALAKRIARLEMSFSGLSKRPLVIVHGVGFEPHSLTGVDGVELPRLEGEEYEDYVARLDTHLRASRGRALPVLFARYGTADAPDSPLLAIPLNCGERTVM